jgi:hypothetical protein
MSKRPIVLLSLAVLILLALPLPTPAADAFSFRVVGSFVVGDQVYDGGLLEFSRVGSGGLMSLRLNGRHIGLLRTQDYGPMPADATPYLVFRRDRASGIWRLDCVRLRGEDTAKVRTVRINPLDLLPGHTTLPETGRTTALATR